MKPTNATLNALLASRQFMTADLYTITLVGGTVLRYCSGQANITTTTLTRASTATYIDAKGHLKTAAVDVVRYSLDPVSGTMKLLTESASTNLVLQSNGFTTTPWAFSGGTVTSAITGPDGVAGSGWLINSNVGNTNGQIQVLSGVFSGSPETASVDIKQATAAGINLGIWDNTAGGWVLFEYFAWIGGVPVAINNPAPGNTNVIALGDGWFRISLTETGTAGHGRGVAIYPESGSNGSCFGNGNYVFGLQYEEQPVATSYIATTSGTATRAADVITGTTTYSAGGTTGPYFDRQSNRAKVTWKTGTGSDSLVIDVVPGSATINGVAFLQAARLGYFDGADFQLDRAFMATYGIVEAGCQVTLFKGRVGLIEADRSIMTMTVPDYRELLNQQIPRNLASASCLNTLGDVSCGVTLATYTVSGTVLAGTTANSINATLAAATGYYDLGKITFTSGTNNGISIGVSTWVTGSPGVITPIEPIPTTPQAGDTFTICAGCDRTLGAGGCTKFSNTANFRGFPYTPAPETAV